MSPKKMRSYSDAVQSIFDYVPDAASQAKYSLEKIVEILVNYADNNSYTVIKDGVLKYDEENLFPVGKELTNNSGAIDDFIGYGSIPHGTIFVSVKRALAREEGIEDPVTDGLPEEFAHKVSFILVDKTLKKYLSAYEVVQFCPEVVLSSVMKRLKCRYRC